MAIGSRIESLQRQHQQLEGKLQEMLKHPGADDEEMAALKRQKLKIKDTIERLRSARQLH